MRSLSRQSRERVLDTSVCSREKGYNWAYVTCSGKHKNTHDYTYMHCSPVTDVVCENSLIKWTHTFHCMFQHVSVTATVHVLTAVCVSSARISQLGRSARSVYLVTMETPQMEGNAKVRYLFLCACVQVLVSLFVCIWKSESLSFKHDFVSVEQDIFSRISRCCFTLNESE